MYSDPGGALLSFGSAINGKLAVPLQSAVGASFINFVVGTAVLCPFFFLGRKPEIRVRLSC